jgi:hypothetical protein
MTSTHPNKSRVYVEAQGQLLTVHVSGPAPLVDGGGTRGAVTEFSTASRKRMLELLARIDLDRAGFTAFVGLTYPDRDGPPALEETERDRQTIFKRLGRAYPECSAIWRREWEARKSGAFVGADFPHYHLLAFGLPFVPGEDLRAIWAEVLGYDGYVRTEIRGVRSWPQALGYVAKYMAKPVESGGGAGRAPARAGAGDAPGSLVYGSYLTAEAADGTEAHSADEGVRKRIGRSWGVFRRRHLPLAETHVLSLDDGEWLLKAKDRARREWEGVNDLPAAGFTLFVPEAETWLRRIEAIHDLHTYGVVSEEFGPELLN